MLETNAPAQMVANARCLNGRNGEILAGPWEREAAVVTPIRYPRPRTRIRRGPTPGLVSPDSPRGAASRYSASIPWSDGTLVDSRPVQRLAPPDVRPML